MARCTCYREGVHICDVATPPGTIGDAPPPPSSVVVVYEHAAIFFLGNLEGKRFVVQQVVIRVIAGIIGYSHDARSATRGLVRSLCMLVSIRLIGRVNVLISSVRQENPYARGLLNTALIKVVLRCSSEHINIRCVLSTLKLCVL